MHIFPCINQCTKWKKYSINYFRYFTFNQLHRCNITVLAAKWTEFLMTNWTKPTTYTTELTNSGKTYLLLLMPVHRAVLPHPTAEATHAFLEEAAFPVWWRYTVRFSQVCWCMEDIDLASNTCDWCSVAKLPCARVGKENHHCWHSFYWYFICNI